ncbi:uncharacterized protein MYCGRDRAFT_95372 [Zymoseptoria tritici IPO323]|uniref:Uncharacterized protein n=1 Tax=Zymoseptoria tritici (strain CBS 115943 / IPO323) TaxID=336722 RepID=F9XIS6_ZYMTI|nr:uncharacterized protein MYCGRDRAFT_95372 [Zymoseptoria tritici IPO323]EGP85123.1 hypothetical protein MYCGRDRAFT_95372 [Zymoseptoria tritici IPO323]
MPVLADLLSQYPIITSLSAFVSTSDLHHLALTSHACRAPIARSFERLMRDCLCDGRGLKMRQNFEGPYWCRDHDWGGALRRSIGSGASFDEPVEVRIWNTVCDTAEALPCLKCGINICEECRVYRREDVHRSKPHRRPHLSSIVHAGQRENLKRNLIYLCPECDVAMEQQILQGHQFLNHLGTTTRVYAVPPCPLRLDLAARGAHVDICPRVNGQARGARLTTNSQFLTRWTHAFRHISDEGNRIRSWPRTSEHNSPKRQNNKHEHSRIEAASSAMAWMSAMPAVELVDGEADDEGDEDAKED